MAKEDEAVTFTSNNENKQNKDVCGKSENSETDSARPPTISPSSAVSSVDSQHLKQQDCATSNEDPITEDETCDKKLKSDPSYCNLPAVTKPDDNVALPPPTLPRRQPHLRGTYANMGDKDLKLKKQPPPPPPRPVYVSKINSRIADPCPSDGNIYENQVVVMSKDKRHSLGPQHQGQRRRVQLRNKRRSATGGSLCRCSQLHSMDSVGSSSISNFEGKKPWLNLFISYSAVFAVESSY